jgi:hypothetical protein
VAIQTRNEDIREELGLTDIGGMMKNVERRNFWKESLKTASRSCSININRKAEDARNVRQKLKGTGLILVTITDQEHNSLWC